VFLILNYQNHKLPFKQLHFDPAQHKYTDEDGLEYISVTTLLQLDDPFDAQEIAKKVVTYPASRYYNMDVKDVILKWEASAPMGTIVHEAVEEYINTKLLPDDFVMQPLIEQFSRLKFRGRLWSEVRLHDKEFLLAGTADLIEEFKDVCYLYDIKTSTGKNDGTLAAFKYKKFVKQLNLYKRMIEQLFNKPCKIMGVLWFREFAEQQENTKLKFVPIKTNINTIKQILVDRKMELMITGMVNHG